MGCSLRFVVAALAGLGLFAALGRVSTAADVKPSPTVHVRYGSGDTELDSLEIGANFFSDLAVPFSQLPEGTTGLMFTCRRHKISQPVDIFAPAGATVFLLIDSNNNQYESDRCPQLHSLLADRGWVIVGEAEHGTGRDVRSSTVLKKTFDTDSRFTISGGGFAGIVVAAQSLAVDPPFVSSHRKRGGTAISTEPSITNDANTSTTSPAAQSALAGGASTVPPSGSTISAAQATTMSSGTSPAAREAAAQYAQASKLARDKYDAAMASAGQAYLSDLNAALDAALAQKDLVEANRINAEIKSFSENNKISASTKPARPQGNASAATLSADASDAQYKLAAKQAAVAYQAAMASAKDKYLLNLQKALDTALIVKDLDQANRIDETMKWLKGSPRTQRPNGPPSQAEDATQLPNGISPKMVQQFAGRIRLTSALVGTQWFGAFSNQIVALGADGHGQTSTGEKMEWVAISDDQVLIIWSTGSVDMWTFDASREHVSKSWVGNQLTKGEKRVGHRVQ